MHASVIQGHDVALIEPGIRPGRRRAVPRVVGDHPTLIQIVGDILRVPPQPGVDLETLHPVGLVIILDDIVMCTLADLVVVQ